MNTIRDKYGNAIRHSHNLAGIRRYVSETPSPIKVLDVSQVGQFEGRLSILFEDGCSFETNFASYNVLCGFVRRWRNTYGAPLTINGVSVGIVPLGLGPTGTTCLVVTTCGN